jgi:hypothetical protein
MNVRFRCFADAAPLHHLETSARRSIDGAAEIAAAGGSRLFARPPDGGFECLSDVPLIRNAGARHCGFDGIQQPLWNAQIEAFAFGLKLELHRP